MLLSPAIVEALGFAAAACTTLAWVPQAVKTIRTRDTRAISLWMQLLFWSGIVLWLVYGLIMGLWPLIIANIVTFILVSIVLVMKIRFG
jgi:MtN3 and saliva related transmembrane protein